MNILLLDGHPDASRLTSHVLEIYRRSLPSSVSVETVAIRDLSFSPILRHGYARRTEWEPDLLRLAEKIDSCDHLVIAFPMWWGSEPAELKGLIDRLFLPGFTFAYHQDDPWWDRFMAGRSADVIATMDTPPIYLRWAYGNALVKRWKRQVLGFCGFKPVRVLALGPVKGGEADRRMEKWSTRIEKLARSIKPAKPQEKQLRLTNFLGKSAPRT
ncbi:MAG: NAD(P)H-dependent oxidoreductase [Erythrobacter sp.]|nr:NAD(P)H-dependent oxidoreductase [Erythrobacter sp.]